MSSIPSRPPAPAPAPAPPHLEALVQALGDAAMLLGADGETILACNDVFARLVQRPLASLAGTPWRALVREDSVAPRARLVAQARDTGKAVTFEDDGPYDATLEHHVTPITTTPTAGGGVELFLWVCRDVASARRAAVELARSETRLNEVQRIGQIGSWELDLVTDRLSWSSETFRMFRVDRDRFGASYEWFLAAIHPGDRDGVDAAYRASLETGMPFAITHRLLLEGAEIRWVHERCETFHDGDGRPLRSLGTVQDVTDRVVSEQQRRELETRFRALLDALPDAVIVHREGRCIYANATALKMLGFERAEGLVGRDIAEIVAPEGQPAVRQALQHPMRPVGPVEGHWVRQDGTAFVVEVLALRVPFDGGPARVVVARDVSARKELAARIAQMDRMIAVGTLAAGVGHEISNPLAYVAGNLDFVFDEVAAVAAGLSPSAPEVALLRQRLGMMQAALFEARQGADRVRGIVRDLCAFSRPEDAAPGRLALAPVLDSAVNMAWSELRHRARLVKTYGPVPDVAANESRVAQVFLNLLVNAAQAIPEGHAADHEVHVVTGTDDAGRAVIEVSDTGAGISPDIAGRIFDPFFTTKPMGVGTGLGLSICQNIVQALGGDITATPRQPRGTTFRVRLPSAPPGDVGAVQPPSPVSATRRAKILVVDDEPLVGRTLARSLSREHDVEAVTRGQELLDRLERGDRFDVVLCDLMMPELTGIDLYERLQARFPEHASRMVFITGGAFTPRAQSFLAQAWVLRIQKPFDMASVRALLREVLEGTASTSRS